MVFISHLTRMLAPLPFYDLSARFESFIGDEGSGRGLLVVVGYQRFEGPWCLHLQGEAF